jgi:membrane-bound lytic murein transglycosylase D
LECLKLSVIGFAYSVVVVGCSTLPPQQAATLSQPGPSRETFEHSASIAPAMSAQQTASHASKRDLIIPDHPAIDGWVAYYTQKSPQSFQACLDRAQRYVKPAQEIFEQRGLPSDLIYIALVESGFSPTARSHAEALGMWQFISSTGRRFGLQQDRWLDERRHPFKSARAAADYLSFLYDTFQSWPLALAAYNAGEKRVQDALEATGLQSFWQLAENGSLPKETSDYVPKIFAAIRVIKEAKHYGFRFDPEQCTSTCATVSVPGGISLASLGDHVGLRESELERHNPELCNGATPPDRNSYPLCVPVSKQAQVATRLSKLSLSPGDFASVPYKVQRGDTLYSLTRKFGGTVPMLAAVNQMRVSDTLKAGKTIRIPLKGSQEIANRKALKNALTKVVAADSRKQQQSSSSTAADRCRLKSYKVRSGDTLWSIARRFQTSLDKVLTHNTLKQNETLHPGRVLTICVAESHLGG